MRSWLRAVLVLLLAAALPLQGWAAATMLACGPSHHRMAGAQVQAQGHHHQQEAAVHERSAHQHEAAASAADRDATAGPGSLHALAKFKCSACAACCVTAALPASVPAFTTEDVARFVAHSVPDAQAVFLTGGVEPPPRILIA
ncbi:MAG: hypothetical protein AB1430_02200 [Pseudomonadota bacterium]